VAAGRQPGAQPRARQRRRVGGRDAKGGKAQPIGLGGQGGADVTRFGDDAGS
jgi:hypothetical protein